MPRDPLAKDARPAGRRAVGPRGAAGSGEAPVRGFAGRGAPAAIAAAAPFPASGRRRMGPARNFIVDGGRV